MKRYSLQQSEYVKLRLQQPKGLFAPFKRKKYQQNLSDWNQQYQKIIQKREAHCDIFQQRINRLNSLNLDIFAKERLQEKFPELAKQLPLALQELRKQRKDNSPVQQFIKTANLRKRNLLTEDQWQKIPKHLQKAIDLFNQHNPQVQNAIHSTDESDGEKYGEK